MRVVSSHAGRVCVCIYDCVSLRLSGMHALLTWLAMHNVQ